MRRQNGQKLSSQNGQNGKFLTENLNFKGHLSTFGAENALKSGTFKTENKAQTLPRQVQNNFEKVDESFRGIDFFDPQNGQNHPSNRPK